jgi:hypothetical protein
MITGVERSMVLETYMVSAQGDVYIWNFSPGNCDRKEAYRQHDMEPA